MDNMGDLDKLWQDAIEEVFTKTEDFETLAAHLYEVVEEAKSVGLGRMAGMITAIIVAYQTSPRAVDTLAISVNDWLRTDGVIEVLKKERGYNGYENDEITY